jgi:hypothetical protein
MYVYTLHTYTLKHTYTLHYYTLHRIPTYTYSVCFRSVYAMGFGTLRNIAWVVFRSVAFCTLCIGVLGFNAASTAERCHVICHMCIE